MAIQEQKSSLQNITTFHRELDTGMNTVLQRVTIAVQQIAVLSEEGMILNLNGILMCVS